MLMLNESRVREAAYLLWEKEGRPSDQAERHWLQAMTLVASTETKTVPVKAKAPKRKLRSAA